MDIAGPPRGRRLAIAAALVGLGVVALGVAVAAGFVDSPLRNDAPPVVAEVSAPPIVAPSSAPSVAAPVEPPPSVVVPSPSPSTEPPIAFASDLYDYQVAYPATWRSVPATERWTPGQAWDRTPNADRFVSPDPPALERVFSVVTTPIDGEEDIDRWIAGSLPERTQFEVHETDGESGHCAVPHPGGNGEAAFGDARKHVFVPATIGGQPARVRWNCGVVDAVVFAPDRAYVLALSIGLDALDYRRSNYPRENDLAGFAALIRTLDAPGLAAADGAGAAGAVTRLRFGPDQEFTSTWYGYRIRHSEAMTAQDAGSTWRPADDWPRGADHFSGLGESYRIASAPIQAGMTAAEWERAPRDLPSFEGCPTAEASWDKATIGGQPGAIRVDDRCGYGEAYAMAGGRVYAMMGTLTTKADMLDFLSTIELRPQDVPGAAASPPVDPNAPYPALPVTIRSNLYGYSIGARSDTVHTLASSRWLPGQMWDRPGSADMYESGAGTLTIASTPATAHEDIDAWMASNLPRRTGYRLMDERTCGWSRSGSFSAISLSPDEPPLVDAFLEARIGGREARVRSVCGYVDAVVIAADRAFVLSLYRGRKPDGEVDGFRRLIETFHAPGLRGPVTRLELTSTPVAPRSEDTELFASDRYGYKVIHPVELVARDAVVSGARVTIAVVPPTVPPPWAPPAAWSLGADSFLGMGLQFTVASAPLPPGATADSFKAAPRDMPRPAGCPTITGAWRDIKIDDEPGGVRVDPRCGYAEAFVLSEDRAYVVTGYRVTEAQMLEFLSTIDLRPGDAFPST
jgi:hypothetical protein